MIDLRVGYWDEKNDPHNQVDKSWDDTERNHVIAYLDSGRVKTRWRGSSNCRFCGQINGSVCLTDGIYMWPEGYSHYLQEHSVKPPQDFLEHFRATIKKLSIAQKTIASKINIGRIGGVV